MLHKINLPACGQRMERILTFQRKVLGYACRDGISWPPTTQDFDGEFGLAGAWLFKKMSTKKKTGELVVSDLQKGLAALVAHIKNNPGIGAKILGAFDHDVTFNKSAADLAYQFHFIAKLDAAAQKVLKELMELFYTDLLAAGFPTAVHGEVGTFDRDAFIAAFEAANPKLHVCPACDGARSDKVDTKVFADADHFLPKSVYPFLSLHPSNLVPLCLDCNRTFKGDRDPIDKHADAPLVNTFHPYVKPALPSIDVNVNRNKEGVAKLEIVDNEQKPPSRRVNSLNRVFKIERRWVDRLKHQIELVRKDVARNGRGRRSRGEPVNANVLKQDLMIFPEDYEQEIGNREHYVCIKAT
jgi:hypothetical protein